MDTGSRSGGAARALRRCGGEIVLIDRAITTSFLPLRISQPGTVEPAARAQGRTQCRADVADWAAPPRPLRRSPTSGTEESGSSSSHDSPLEGAGFFWSLNQSSSTVLTPDAMAGHIGHVCFRRAPRINPARDSAIAPGQPHPQRKGRSAPGLTTAPADSQLDHRLGPAPLPRAAR
jgi:hypothetical protein